MATEKIYTVTRKMFPGFVKLYEYANGGTWTGARGAWEILYEISDEADSMDSAITYTKEQRIILNETRATYLKDPSQRSSRTDWVRELLYYKGVLK